MNGLYLYFNIVTHKVQNWDSLSDNLKKAYENHLFKSADYGTAEDQYNDQAPLVAEYAKVINVSFGYKNSEGVWKEASVTSANEKELLQKVSAVIDAFAVSNYSFAGYNVTYFDIPFLTKRFVINGIRVPDSLKRYDKKYWEINDFNLKQVWKFNSQYDVPLEVICASLNIDIKNLDDIYEVFGKPISEVDLNEVAKLSELRNRLVHAVREKIMDLIE